MGFPKKIKYFWKNIGKTERENQRLIRGRFFKIQPPFLCLQNVGNPINPTGKYHQKIKNYQKWPKKRTEATHSNSSSLPKPPWCRKRPFHLAAPWPLRRGSWRVWPRNTFRGSRRCRASTQLKRGQAGCGLGWEALVILCLKKVGGGCVLRMFKEFVSRIFGYFSGSFCEVLLCLDWWFCWTVRSQKGRESLEREWSFSVAASAAELLRRLPQRSTSQAFWSFLCTFNWHHDSSHKYQPTSPNHLNEPPLAARTARWPCTRMLKQIKYRLKNLAKKPERPKKTPENKELLPNGHVHQHQDPHGGNKPRARRHTSGKTQNPNAHDAWLFRWVPLKAMGKTGGFLGCFKENLTKP